MASVKKRYEQTAQSFLRAAPARSIIDKVECSTIGSRDLEHSACCGIGSHRWLSHRPPAGERPVDALRGSDALVSGRVLDGRTRTMVGLQGWREPLRVGCPPPRYSPQIVPRLATS